MSMVNTKKRSHTERVKGELEQLRNDVQALEAVFKRLKKNTAVLTVHWSPSTPPDSGRGLSQSGSEWMEIVVEQCRRRRESEALNRRLRSMLGKLVSTVHASEGALAFKFTDADFNALYGTELDADMARSLSLRAQAVQLDVGSILKRTGLVHIDSLLSWSQRSHDVSLGVFFEVTSCLPVRYSLEQIREAFARQCPCTDGQIVDVQLDGIDVYKRKSARVEYQTQLYDIAINGALRVLAEDDDRIVYVWTSQASLRVKRWTFFEDSILIVRRANANVSTSLLQKWHRVWVQQPTTPSASDPLVETILSSLSRRGSDHVRIFKSSLENTMSLTGQQ